MATCAKNKERIGQAKQTLSTASPYPNLFASTKTIFKATDNMQPKQHNVYTRHWYLKWYNPLYFLTLQCEAVKLKFKAKPRKEMLWCLIN